jgi:hypothetical protein
VAHTIISTSLLKKFVKVAFNGLNGISPNLSKDSFTFNEGNIVLVITSACISFYEFTLHKTGPYGKRAHLMKSNFLLYKRKLIV